MHTPTGSPVSCSQLRELAKCHHCSSQNTPVKENPCLQEVKKPEWPSREVMGAVKISTVKFHINLSFTVLQVLISSNLSNANAHGLWESFKPVRVRSLPPGVIQSSIETNTFFSFILLVLKIKSKFAVLNVLSCTPAHTVSWLMSNSAIYYYKVKKSVVTDQNSTKKQILWQK